MMGSSRLVPVDRPRATSVDGTLGARVDTAVPPEPYTVSFLTSPRGLSGAPLPAWPCAMGETQPGLLLTSAQRLGTDTNSCKPGATVAHSQDKRRGDRCVQSGLKALRDLGLATTIKHPRTSRGRGQGTPDHVGHQGVICTQQRGHHSEGPWS